MGCDFPARQCLEWHIQPHLQDVRTAPMTGTATARAVRPTTTASTRSASAPGTGSRSSGSASPGCSRTRVRAVLIERGVPPGCLPFVAREREDLLEALRVILAADTADHARSDCERSRCSRATRTCREAGNWSGWPDSPGYMRSPPTGRGSRRSRQPITPVRTPRHRNLSSPAGHRHPQTCIVQPTSIMQPRELASCNFSRAARAARGPASRHPPREQRPGRPGLWLAACSRHAPYVTNTHTCPTLAITPCSPGGSAHGRRSLRGR